MTLQFFTNHLPSLKGFSEFVNGVSLFPQHSPSHSPRSGTTDTSYMKRDTCTSFLPPRRMKLALWEEALLSPPYSSSLVPSGHPFHSRFLVSLSVFHTKPFVRRVLLPYSTSSPCLWSVELIKTTHQALPNGMNQKIEEYYASRDYNKKYHHNFF